MTLLVVAGVLIGLLIGSFLNVVAYRVPRGISVVSPPSACPECGNRVRPRDNVPVVGWLLLHGRCRDCQAHISARYPIVEALTGALFGVAVGVVGATGVLPAYWWFIAVTVVLTLTDLDERRIPNRILYPGAIAGTLLLGAGAAVEGDLSSFGRGIAGGAVYFGLLLLIALAARGGFGFGDVKLALFLGEFAAYQSWGALAAAIFFGFLLGGLISIGLLVSGRRGRKDAIPFGPSMIAGAYLAVVVGGPVVAWYLGQ